MKDLSFYRKKNEAVLLRVLVTCRLLEVAWTPSPKQLESRFRKVGRSAKLLLALGIDLKAQKQFNQNFRAFVVFILGRQSAKK